MLQAPTQPKLHITTKMFPWEISTTVSTKVDSRPGSLSAGFLFLQKNKHFFILTKNHAAIKISLACRDGGIGRRARFRF